MLRGRALLARVTGLLVTGLLVTGLLVTGLLGIARRLTLLAPRLPWLPQGLKELQARELPLTPLDC